MNFAIVGAAGYIAPRHMRAIRDTGHRIVSACDPHDAVGVLDSFAPTAEFFSDTRNFMRDLYIRRGGTTGERVDVVSVCSPNHLHASHVAQALHACCDVICEKPLGLDLDELAVLRSVESSTGRRVCTVLQLRLHPALLNLRWRLPDDGRRHYVEVTYVTPRGPWYDVSWKGDEQRSGGIITNIGIHVFDLLIWLFGRVQRAEMLSRDRHLATGILELARADVQWRLSTMRADLPPGRTSSRSLVVDGESIEFGDGFTDLHTRVYEEIFAGRGVGIEDARPSIELVHRLRHAPVTQSRVLPAIAR